MENLKFGDNVKLEPPSVHTLVGRVIALGAARMMDGAPLQVTVQWRPGYVELVETKFLVKVE